MKKYLPLFKKRSIVLTEVEHKRFHSEEYREFRELLVKKMEAKVAENLDLLVHHGNKGDEARGKLLGAVLVYEDLLDWFTKKPEKQKKGYKDVVNKIAESVRKK